jgi:serine protease
MAFSNLRMAGTTTFSVMAVAVLLVAWAASSAVAMVPQDLASPLDVQLVERPLYDTKTITVKFRGDVDRARAADVVAELGCSIHRPSLYTPGLNEIRIPAGGDILQWIKTFGSRLDVEYAEPTYFDHIAFTPNDPSYSSQWNFTMIGMPNAWDKVPSRGSTSVVVAVQDSGVAYEDYGTDYIMAPDLENVNFVSPRDIVNNDYHANDDNHHGTHVCGTIAQKTNNGKGVAGMADGVSIMPVKSLDWCGSGSHSQFSDGVHWAVDNGADVINYSAGGTASTTKEQAVNYAYTNGVLLIAAMGNNNQQNSVYAYPGAYDEAMGVGAVDPGKSRAWYSNWGTGIDVVAPGGETSPTVSNGVLQNTFYAGPDDPGGCPDPVPQPKNMDYYYFQGTSMATPHVTGLAALLITQGTYTTRSQVKSRIQGTCEDLGTAGYDTTFGWGLINANAAIPAAGGPPTLEWAGIRGFASDGVDPNTGYPAGHASETRFYFKVKYKDGDGDVPTRAQCVIQRLLCDGTWTRARVLTMTPARAGSFINGKIYRASAKLSNEVYRYRFSFKAADGVATGPPASYEAGPKITAEPMLCWAGLRGLTSDGVHPDSGAAGTRFTFKVKYMDSWGSVPTTTNLQIRRYRRVIKTIPMIEGVGTYREGLIYRAQFRIRRPGVYYYRFNFADGIGTATGAPSKWTAGPTITGTLSAGMVTSLSAQQTNAGAQLTFSLSDDAAVTATVMNVAGRPVRTIARDKSMEAGMNMLLWDRRSETGLAVPAGLYMVRVEAKLDDGQTTSAMATLAVR